MSNSEVVTSKVTIVPLSEKWFKDAKVTKPNEEHLLNSLHNLEVGRDPTPSFSLYGKSDSSVVKDFLDSVVRKATDVPPGWIEYEFDRLEKKFGPQGGYRPWKELSEIFHMYQEHLADCVVSNSVLTQCLDNYKSIFCSMLSVDQTLATLIASNKIESRAAGCRDFKLKKTDKIAQQHAIQDFRSGLETSFFMYTFSRYYKNKPRIFMPGPFASMLDQARFVVPFLSAIQNDIKAKRNKSKLVQHADKIGFDECFDIMSEEVRDFYSSHNPNDWYLVYAQGDFEKMDTSTGSNQYESIFIPCMGAAFRFSEKSNPYSELTKSMIKTTQMPIASPEGMMVGEHGTGSGMENTNIGEGCCNDYYQQRTISIMVEEKPDMKDSWKLVSRRVNGDDSVYVFAVKKTYDVAEFTNLLQNAAISAAEECGFRINDKWRVSTDWGLFCQNCFYWDPVANKIKWMYPSSLILDAIVNPEHEYSPTEWDKDYRDIDICEKLDNGRYLPYFKDLVLYVDNGMKYRLLGKSERETSRILSKFDKYRALQYRTERYNREDWTPSGSPTVNLVLSMRRG